MRYSIAYVARETGVSAMTLRKWEARYGYPRPCRTSKGVRRYSQTDILSLLTIKRRLDMGGRPGHVLPEFLAQESMSSAARRGDRQCAASPDTLAMLLAALEQHDTHLIRGGLERELQARGVGAFVREIAAPLTTAVGEAWLEGRIGIHTEHFYSQLMHAVLDGVRAPPGRQPARPRVLLCAPPGERHTLGLQMVKALFSDAGADCMSLGADLPIREIAAAARAHDADVVGLSFSAAYPAADIPACVAALRASLPPQVVLWLGGRGIDRPLVLPEGVSVFARPDQALAALADMVDKPVLAVSDHASTGVCS